MKNARFLLWVVLFVYGVSCSDDNTIFNGNENTPRIKGSGNIVSEDRSVSLFTKVDSETSVEINIVEGMEQSVMVSADDNVIGRVNTTVSNNTLKVDLDNGSYSDITINVEITVDKLEGLKNTGSGNIVASGFDEVPRMEVENAGSGSVTLSGSGDELFISNSGSGSYSGFNYTVKSCMVTNAGSGKCEIHCTESLSGSNSGSGSISYMGTPTVDITNTGSGSVGDAN